MLDRILVPLDGSELSAQILWQVRRLLLEGDAQVELYRAVVPILESWRERQADRPDREQRHPDLRLEDARRSLEEIGVKLTAEGLKVTTEVELGDPAELILRRAQSTRPSLVAMATHGRSGPSRWLRGSVAQRVMRECRAPLLLVNPGAVEKDDLQTIRFRKVLVPLDGSERAALVQPLVREFAKLYESEVVLLRVWGSPGALAEAPANRSDALESFRQELEAAGIAARVRSEVGYPAREILAAAEAEGADLVALTTHGRTGLARWFFGSVAEKVFRGCGLPLLIANTRPEETA